MTRKRHTEEQIIAVLQDAQAGVSVSGFTIFQFILANHLPVLVKETR